jgi:hypothetical protein
MKKYLLVILCVYCAYSAVLAQKEDARWVLGTFAQLNFATGNSIYETGNFNTITAVNNASICDKNNDEILIYCHGSIIYNKLGVPMENGDSINPGKYIMLYYPTDVMCWNGSIILPNIYHNNQYYVFYTNVDSFIPGEYLPTKLYYSLVDMNFNNGLGKVIQKDVTVLNHLLEPGRLNAIQHANGRDWWLVVNGFMDTQHFIYLVDYTGIHLVNTQTIGSPFISNIHRDYQCVVNQSGTQLAYLYNTLDNIPNLHDRIDLYDFDRCSGLLSNYKTITVADSCTLNGIAFSPNDSLLYVNTFYNLYQFNLNDAMDTNKINVGRWDSTYDPFQTIFNLEKLGSDGKIYVSTWNSTHQLHCITHPNIRGSACNFVQGYFHTDSSNHYFRGSLPNYPNFHLGALVGSACDTVQGVVRPEIGTEGVKESWNVFPNPNNGVFQLSNLNNNFGQVQKIEVYNTIGQLVLTINKPVITNESFNLNLSNLQEGNYLLNVLSSNSNSIIKINIVK